MKQGRTFPREIGTLSLLSALIAGLACSGEDDDRPGAFQGRGGEAGSGGSGAGRGGKGGGTADGGSDASGGGDVGEGGMLGEGGGPVSVGCGDSVKGSDEECDGLAFGGLSCIDYGFDEGELACTETCTADTSGCSGVEHCADGRDNDGDTDSDCDDEDCAEACAEPCAAPAALSDPADLEASTLGRANVQASACSSGDSGSDVAYSFTAENTGTLEIALDTAQPLHVVVRNTCSDASAEIACGGPYLSLPVTAGDELFIIVDGNEATDFGGFGLRVQSRENDVCADGFRDASEQCDDGNTDPNDGCDGSCDLELDESEANDDSGSADAYTGGFVAQISPEGDEDFVAVEVATSPSSIRARTSDFGEDCERGDLDSLLELIDTDGTTVLLSDDDGGSGYCSDVVVSGLPAGTYFVRVAASPAGQATTFPYKLDVTVNACGNGLLGPGEECDDGNITPGDGCDATCQDE